MKKGNQNVFVKSAELGLPFGALLTVASISMQYFDMVQALLLVVMLIIVIAPVVLLRYQVRYFVESDGFATFSELWSLGIFTTICGSLICAMLSYGAATLFRPDFLYEQAQWYIDFCKHNHLQQLDEVVDVLQKMIKHNLMPSVIDYYMQMMCYTTSLGCMGGALTAYLAGLTPIGKIEKRTKN